MKKHYKTIKRFGLRAFALGLMLTGSGWAHAQLNGTFTLDNGSPTSGTNFNNWADFATALNTSGVSGSVTLNVMSSLTATGTIQLNQFAGSSSTNTVTINGNGNSVTFPGTSTVPQVFLFNGADFVTISNLVIRNSGTVVNVHGLRFTNNSDNNTITRCTVEFSALTALGSSSGGAYVAFSANTSQTTSLGSGALANGNGANNVIINNLMRTTNGNTPGPFSGIYETQSTSNYTSTAYNNTFRGNTIQNFCTYGINSQYTNGSVIANNDISRANVTSGLPASTTYPIYQFYVNSTNRSIRIDSNKVHDLPFVNAVTTSAHTASWNIQFALTTGTSTLPMSVRGNEVYNVITNTGGNLGIFGQVVSFCNVRDNRIDNLRNNSTSTSLTNGALQGIYFSGGDNINVINNRIQRCRPFQTFYGIYMANQGTSTTTKITENTLKDNQSTSQNFSFYYTYGIYANNGAWDVSRNMIDELIQQGPYGYCIPFYANVTGATHNWFSNIATHCIGAYYTWGLYSNVNSGATLNFRQNTMNFPYATSSFGYSYYQWFHYGFGTGITNYEGNVMVSNTNYYWGMYYGSTTNNCRYSNNHIWAPNSFWGGYFYSPASGTVWDYATWRNNGFGGQTGDMNRNPRFMNVNSRDLRCQDFMTQNNVPTLAVSPVEFNGNNRNPVRSDRGAMESFMDITRVRSNLNVPASVCSGWEQNIFMTVRNLYADTAYNFNVSYSSNNGPKTSVAVTTRLLQNDTSKVTFAVPIRLNAVGTTRVAVYIDIPDDDRTNDSFVFVTDVKPAPGGGRYAQSSTPTNAFYQLGRPFDVTQVNMPVYYTINAPRVYNNSSYWNGSGSSSGKNWTASTYAETKRGKVLVSGATSITRHAGANDLEVRFQTSNTALEDSVITMVTRIVDLNNNCDTFIRRDILIYPTITPDFGFPSKICDGDDVSFEQKSTVNSGGMEFFWTFGTGVAADTSNAPEPVFSFPRPGTYKVKMTARTLPYNFPSYDSSNVVVGPVPTVKFTKNNACEGNDVVFNNQTTPSTGVNSSWNFGNGVTRNDNNATVRYRYPAAGAYTVTLTANLNGCVASSSQRVYQFPKPKAKYVVTAGNCDNDEWKFENQSTITSGTIGSFWDFDDGSFSTAEDPEHMFPTSGIDSVKLVVTSVFGCKDSFIDDVHVLESPKVAFANTPACSRTATEFTNTTPVVAGAGGVVKSYSWNFGDGGTSAAQNPSHNWSTLGPKTVSFSMELMNGCKNTTSKVLNVGIQPKAAFTVQDICLGQPAVFVNNTTWPQGDISYLWNFGDGTTSTSTSPIHTYSKAFGPNVTLYASIAGGCTDSALVALNIFEGPRTCDFTAVPDYAFGFYGVAVNPLNAGTGVSGGQDRVTYTWIFEGGGTNQTNGINAATQYNFQSDGVYNVTMRARSQSAPFCECSKTKQVVMNRASAKDLEETGMALFPNPNNGQFNIVLKETFGRNVTVEVTNMAGAVIKQISAVNNGAISINTGDIADGVYLVRVRSGENTAVRRITVRK